MPFKIIAKIKEKLAEIFTTKTEFDDYMVGKADLEDVPTLISELTNDSDFIMPNSLELAKKELNGMGVSFEDGILAITFLTIPDYYYYLLNGSEPLVLTHAGGLATGDGFFYNSLIDYDWGSGYIATGWKSTKEWTLQANIYANSNVNGNNSYFIIKSLDHSSRHIKIQDTGQIYLDDVYEGTVSNLIWNTFYDGGLKHIEVRKNKNHYTVYLDEENFLEFNYDGFNDNDNLTIEMDYTGTRYARNEIKFDSILINRQIEFDTDFCKLELESNEVTTYSSPANINCTITNNVTGEAVNGVYVVAFNTEDETIYYGNITNSNGETTIHIPVTDKESNYIVRVRDSSEELSITFYNYILVCSDSIETATGNAIINVVLTEHNERIIGETIGLYLDDTLVEEQTTNQLGEVNFSVTITENTNYVIKYGNITSKNVEVKLLNLSHTYLFDGTEQMDTNSNRPMIASNGVLTGGEGAILSYHFINVDKWDFKTKIKLLNDGSPTLILPMLTSNNNGYDTRNVVKLSNSGALTVHWENRQMTYVNIQSLVLGDDYVDFKLEKLGETSFRATLGETSVEFTSIHLAVLTPLLVGMVYYIREYLAITDTTYTYTPFEMPQLTTTFNPALDGTEELTAFNNYFTINNNTLIGGNGILKQGFTNTDYWLLSFDVKQLTHARDCSVGIIKSGTTRDTTAYSLRIGLTGWCTIQNNGTGSGTRLEGVDSPISITTEYTTIKIQRVSEHIIEYWNDDNTPHRKIYWEVLPEIEALSIATFNAGGENLSIKNIIAKTSTDEE